MTRRTAHCRIAAGCVSVFRLTDDAEIGLAYRADPGGAWKAITLADTGGNLDAAQGATFETLIEACESLAATPPTMDVA